MLLKKIINTLFIHFFTIAFNIKNPEIIKKYLKVSWLLKVTVSKGSLKIHKNKNEFLSHSSTIRPVPEADGAIVNVPKDSIIFLGTAH